LQIAVFDKTSGTCDTFTTYIDAAAFIGVSPNTLKNRLSKNKGWWEDRAIILAFSRHNKAESKINKKWKK